MVLAGWFVATVVSQHPGGGHNRIRRLDKTGSGMLIPNWRFFAPNPAVEDRHFLYRLASEDMTRHTEWREVQPIAQRRLAHAFWFPDRRSEKAIVDAAGVLLSDAKQMDPATRDSRRPVHRLISRFVQAKITPDPEYPLFQIMLVRYAGYDHGEQPKYDLVFEYQRVGSV
ncbi:hypothetical protein DVA86_21745 [Streptomyces armeniacus]|uniref:Uncharacterized protein n=1 Tax=Streptomyces armeniacus TaxID=83291 RepID=A0A345XTB4_9ACTN|nr:hypothetical protein DVA86_21745 [Streptomyces armeniacus]